jgi:hypothetical protein
MSNDKKVVEVPEDVFNSLMENDALLEALKACGVDNWHGYPEAIEMFLET